MSYLCDLFFIFSLIFIVSYHITSFKLSCLFFVHFLEYLLLFLDNNVTSFVLALFLKVFLIKKKRVCDVWEEERIAYFKNRLAIMLQNFL